MAQLLRCQLPKHKGVSSDPQHPCKSQVGEIHSATPLLGAVKTGGYPELTDYPVNRWSLQVEVGVHLKKLGGKMIEEGYI